MDSRITLINLALFTTGEKCLCHVRHRRLQCDRAAACSRKHLLLDLLAATRIVPDSQSIENMLVFHAYAR